MLQTLGDYAHMWLKKPKKPCISSKEEQEVEENTDV